MSGATIGRLYALLLRLLPARFHARFAPEMRRMFEDGWRDAGPAGRATMALRAVADVAWTAAAVRLAPGSYAPPAPLDAPTPAPSFSGLGTDALAALRGLRRRPAFAATAALTAGLGIAATIAVFSVADATVLHGLGLPQEGRLVSVWGSFDKFPGQEFRLSQAEYVDVRDEARSFARVGAWSGGELLLEPQGDRTARTVNAAFTYGDVYALVGARVALGRLPGPADDRPDAPLVALLSDALWRATFGGDPAVVGTATVPVGRARALVIGVLTPDAGGALPGTPADVWVHQSPPAVDATTNRSGHGLNVVGLLRAGATAAESRAELSALQRRWSERYVGRHSFGIDGHAVRAAPLGDRVLGTARRVALLLSVASCGLLLLACANVASLLLARGETRTSEVGVRIAMGASSGRVARPMLLEGLALAAAGGGLGLGAAALGLPALLRLAPAELAGRVPASVDGSAVAFAVVASLLTGALFTLAPAWRAARRDPSALLHASGGGRGRTAALRGLRWLVGGQAALATLLLVGAALFARSLRELTAVDPGVDARGRVVLDVILPRARYRDAASVLAFHDALLRRLEGVAGVRRAALVRALPVRDAQRSEYVLREGMAMPEGLAPVSVQATSAGALRALGIPLLQGRDLAPGDRAGAVRVALVNATAARTLWPGESPLGKRVRPTFAPESLGLVTIVGVYGDVRSGGLATTPTPEIVFPVAQGDAWAGWIRDLTLVVESGSAPASTIAAARAAVRELEPGAAVESPTTMRDVLRAGAARQRFLAALLAVFAGLALAIAAVGVFSAVSFMVARQTRELAIRSALGAGRGRTVRDVVRTSAGVAGAGAVVGALVAAAATPAVSGFLYGVSPHDGLVFAGVPLALVAVAVLAGVAPAVRAVRVPPARALQDAE